jgi:hypothetical protein
MSHPFSEFGGEPVLWGYMGFHGVMQVGYEVNPLTHGSTMSQPNLSDGSIKFSIAKSRLCLCIIVNFSVCSGDRQEQELCWINRHNL